MSETSAVKYLKDPAFVSLYLSDGEAKPEGDIPFTVQSFRKIVNDCTDKIYQAQCRANTYRRLNILFGIFIIGAGTTISMVLAFDDHKNYPAIILGLTIIMVQSLHQFFRIGKRGPYFKEVRNRIRSILRKTKEAILFIDNDVELVHLIHTVQKELDELDYESFKASYGSRVKYEAPMAPEVVIES